VAAKDSARNLKRMKSKIHLRLLYRHDAERRARDEPAQEVITTFPELARGVTRGSVTPLFCIWDSIMSKPSRNNVRKTRVRGIGRPFAKGNPGRPKGARHKATVAAEALLDGEAEALVFHWNK
jgi:hypothetical protein